MKCFSCETEINPKWKNAIENNVCPFCGDKIVDEVLKTLLNTLRETMEGLKDFQKEVDDYLFANHNYIKTDAENLYTFVPKEILKDVLKDDDVEFQKRKNKRFKTKIDAGNGEEEITVEQIQSDEKTSEFAKRAEAVKPNIEGFSSVAEKTQHLKAMAQKIRREGNSTSKPGIITADMIQDMETNEDEVDVELLQSQIMNSGNMIDEELSPFEESLPFNEDLPRSPFANMTKQGKSQQQQNDIDKLRNLQARSGNAARERALSGQGSFSR